MSGPAFPVPVGTAAVLVLVALAAVAAQPPIDFDREVKPLFAARCVSCHGPAKQKGGLRLDRRADALNGGDSGPALAAGKPADSLLLHLVGGDDPDRVMPPSGDRLTAAQLATLRAWVQQGAEWPADGSAATNPLDWWAFKPVKRPPVPAGVHPVDHFVRAKLLEKGLAPSPEADRRTLIRRLTFDLIGLPPTPEEIDAFLSDDAPDAYDRLVDRLLASPHYGERWARHWLDVVRFGETHGYDKDQPRPHAWPYRDYVIRSLNQDKPFARFVQEQVAGDVLFPGTRDGVEALGFLSAGPWDLIGHAELPETKIDGKVARHLDRDDVVSNVAGTFLSLTVHCAQCHNHKFDPVTQEDYYRLQAVFAAIDRTDKAFDPDPAVAARRKELDARRAAATANVVTTEAAIRKRGGEALAAAEAAVAAAGKKGGAVPPEFGYHSAIETRADVPKWVQVDLGEAVKVDRIVLRPCHDDFGGIGAGFGFPVRYKVEASDDPAFQTGVVTLADRTAADQPRPGTAAVALPAGGRTARYVRLTATKLAARLPADFILAVAELEVMDAAGKNRAAGRPATSLDSIEAPVRWGRANLTDGRFPAESVPAAERAKLAARRDALRAKATTPADAAALAAAAAERAAAEAALKALPPAKMAYVGAVHTGSGNFAGTGAAGGRPRPIHLLPRGDVTRPGKEVGPGAVAALNGKLDLPANHTEADRRAALARWLTAPEHPLVWRSIVNRVWQYHFGRGIVETPNDFGKMGQPPTHPELLDWLAAEMIDPTPQPPPRNGEGEPDKSNSPVAPPLPRGEGVGGRGLPASGSLKHLHRLIVTSATYRQVSASNPVGAKVDADNRYLWRQSRRKLEAEAVRDSILTAAGKLSRQMGGPSYKDFVVEKPEHSPHYQYHLANPDDPATHRRAVYRFAVRSKPEPFLAALDCADPSAAVDRRNQTITPQQALALLNNKLTVAMAGHFARRVEGLAADDGGRATAAFRLALGREPTADERTAVVAYAKAHGWPHACRAVLNLNEFAFVD